MTGVSPDPFFRAIELEERSPSTYVATTQYVPWPKAYGGDLLVQAAASAIRSVGSDRVLHSMHSSFLSAATIGALVRYEVERLRDGRSYSTRQVRAYQDDRLIFVATVSFHIPEDGDDFAPPAPRGVPAPETLPSSAETLAGVAGDAARYWSSGRSFDIRHVPSPIYQAVAGAREAAQIVWIRPFSPLSDDPTVHLLALIYVCDYTMLEPILRQQGRAWSDAGLVTASLDHALWMHRPRPLDDWIMFVQRGESAQAGRGLGSGSFYARDGSLIATVLQEGAIRSS